MAPIVICYTNSMKNNPDIDAYIGKAPKEHQKLLKELRVIIFKEAPDAEEVLNYKIPAYKYKGMLAYMAAHKNHVGLYAMPTSVVKYKTQLKGYATSKATIQFPLGEKIPTKLIADIIKFRVAENEKKAAAKKKK